jgi:four helix bundle protein
MLDYEKLDAYQISIQHLTFVFKTLPTLPRGYAALTDQWRRAAMSVPLNIAEAVGKTSAADRSNRCSIARGEAMECGALLELSGCSASSRMRISTAQRSCSSGSFRR